MAHALHQKGFGECNDKNTCACRCAGCLRGHIIDEMRRLDADNRTMHALTYDNLIPLGTAIWKLQMQVKYLSEQLERMLPHRPVEDNSPQGGGSSSE